MSESRQISSKERHCISDCIREYWGDNSARKESQNRNDDYEQCLSDCKVCG